MPLRLTADGLPERQAFILGSRECSGHTISPDLCAGSVELATPGGLEPPASRLEGGCSIQLSYGAVWP